MRRIMLALVCLFCFVSTVAAKEYFINPVTKGPGAGDDGKAGDRQHPWATFSKAMKVLRPGDTLWLMDGTYSQSLLVTVSGTANNYIYIKAQNEGSAIVSTTYPTSALSMGAVSYVEIDGINFRNSGIYDPDVYCSTNANRYAHVHGISVGHADHIILRRVTVKGSSGCNSMNINLAGTTNSLLEDVAASGQGRVNLNIINASNIVVRRCWLNWTGPSTGGGDTPCVNQIYDSDNVTLENCYGTSTQSSGVGGMGTWIHYNSNGSGNQMIGNIMYLPIAPAIGAFSDQADCGKTSSGTVIKNNVALALAGGSGFTEECANYNNGTVLSNNTFVGNNGINSRGVLLSYRRTCPLQKAAIATAYNNSFLNLRNGFMIGNSGVNNHLLERGYNNLYNVTLSVYDPDGYIAGPKPSPETTMNPHYDTAVAKYGFGAYLMVPAALQGQGKVIDSVATDIGANVLFQYTGGEFGTALSLDTTKQLWPWPMEERIYEEYGVSPTYMYRNGDSLSTGGLWLGTPASSSFSNLYKHLRKPRL